MSDLFIKAQTNYDNGTSKSTIEGFISGLTSPLSENNLKFKLIQWKYFRDGTDEIDGLRSRNAYNQMYLNVLENNISNLLSDARTKLTQESNDIEKCFARKNNSIKNSEEREKIDTKKELSILHRLNRMPEDVVGVIGEFLFTKRMRLVLIRDRFAPFTKILRKVKLPKLKTISRCVSHHVQCIANKILKNKHIMSCFPPNSEISECFHYARQCIKNRRETLNKPDKIKEIESFADKASYLVRSVDKLGYPINTGHIQTILLRIYHIIIYACKPEFNKRGNRAYSVTHL